MIRLTGGRELLTSQGSLKIGKCHFTGWESTKETPRPLLSSFGGCFVVQSHQPLDACGEQRGLARAEQRSPCCLKLPRENPPAVEKPPPFPQGLSQPGFVLPLCEAESGQGRVPGNPSETWELPAQPSSRQALLFRRG